MQKHINDLSSIILITVISSRIKMAPITTDPVAEDNNTYFLYALIKEGGVSDGKTQTNLRIVRWSEYAESQFPACFVIYGDRTPIGSATSSEGYITYRLQLYSIEHVLQFVKTILVPDQSSVIELHQFVGYTDNSEDGYNIDWQNTREDKSTEIVAFDAEYTPFNKNAMFRSDGKYDFQSTLENVLNVLENTDVV